MTQIKGFIPPTRKPGVLGVHSVDHFTLQVPDLAEAQAFYSNFGLDVRERDGGLELYTFDHPHRWARIVEGKRKQLLYVSFGAYEDDMEGFRDRLQRLGIARLDPPQGFETNGLWFRDPDGTLIEIGVAKKCSPDQKSSVSFTSAGPGVRAMPMRDQMPRAYPRRLSHVLVFSRDIPGSIRFYSDTVGVRLSDEAGPVAFMHGVHGSDHHMIAFAHSEGPGFHHCSWDVETVQDIGVGAMHMADSGFSRGWGFGRHVLGSNYFHYVRDPWGSYSEYSCDIDYVSVDMEWEGKSHAPENGFYLWGPKPPADFALNYETEANAQLALAENR